MKNVLRLLRVKHYIKNFLVFLPLIFGGKLFDGVLFKRTSFAFLAFCFVSSVIYVFNDIMDVDKDRKHPTKCNRPIANGTISINKAMLICVISACLAIICVLKCEEPLTVGMCMIVYALLNAGYSLGLKNIPIIDLSILVAGFFIRVLVGSFVTNIDISGWLFLTVISGSFYLALGKRRNECRLNCDNETREVLRYYNYSFLDKNMYMCMSLMNVFYALWAVGVSQKTMWTVPLIIIISMKYSLNIEGDSDGDPIEVILKDRLLLALGITYVISILLSLYI